jgi:hypothetical protein
MDYLEQQIQENPARAQALQDIEQHTRQWIKSGENEKMAGVVTIPVVFHVIYNTSAENISTAQIQTQLDVLNEDFRRLNSDADGTWSQAADTEIEFCLATIDPNGNPTTGITRTSTSVSAFGTNDQMKFNSSGGKDAWPAGDYLNFWVCDISGGILGYAQFPGGSASTDGVVCDYQYVGTIGTATSPFDLGRTATHEVGHWLNLRHIWGDGNCNADDFVSDTPTSDAANYGCATGHVSCNSTDMVQNYMDYSDDACMNLYTNGQKTRMQALFAPGGFRESLLSSAACGEPAEPTCTDGIQNGNETGVDCGGSCPACPPCTTVTLTLILDNYPEETSWQIVNASNQVVESGGTYGSQPDGSTVVVNMCLIDGCYDFIINDSYGDGICCSYGNGSYSVTSGGNTFASGGSFGSSEITNFCVGGGSTPTCTDGVQNGNETGVDCGGPDCPACPTCTDGVQNGNETGVDCGGPDCPACPTCTDGVQNGNETGVDCGGPDCPACPTCADGVQNGNESGVDCGGPDCPACPTCTDGVQNGNETGIDCGGPDCVPCSSGCNENEVSLTLIFDNYPEETSWTIINGNGQTAESGNNYGSQPDGSTLVIDICLPDGCYDFNIFDTYGDGICCGFGNGSYVLTGGGSTLASGGSFGSSETTNFCVGGVTAPTCNDNIQNGNETGVDCGGPDCPACPTCTDGVQNGNETGVDCGGPDCPACPTCTDGVQNGNESGVDCGGPDCDPCGGTGPTTLFGHFFESGWDGWSDGGSDCYRYSGTRSWEGSYSIRIRDNSGTNSAMTSSSYDVSAFNTLDIEFYFYPNSMENGEDFWVRFYDGSTWHTVATYASGTSFNNDSFYTSTVTISSANYNFPSNAQFRFQCDASGNADRVYIDAVTVTGYSGSSRDGGLHFEPTITLLNDLSESDADKFNENEVLLYPNPVSDLLNIEAEEDVSKVEIYSITGQLVQTQYGLDKQMQIDVKKLNPGLYILAIESADEIIKQKFVKQ